jgi:hypothetical protein
MIRSRNQFNPKQGGLQMKRLLIAVSIIAVSITFGVGLCQAQSDNQFCFTSIPDVSTTHTIYMLSYTGLQNGHMVIAGEICYSFPPYDPVDPNSNDCFPVIGSAILFEDKLEMVTQSGEFHRETGVDMFFSGTAHLWVNRSTFVGEYNRNGIAWIAGEIYEYYEHGSLEPLKCPVRAGEAESDNNFKKTIKAFDKRF